MTIKKPKDREKYRQAALLSTEILKQLVQMVKPGVLPIEIDKKALELCKKNRVKPAFMGVEGHQGPYEYSTCISVNETVVHGVPSKDVAFKTGDLVKVDFGLVYKGFYTDQCVTVGVGELSKKRIRLVETARESVQEAVKLAVEGNTTGLLGSTMHQIAKKNGFDTLKNYTGHGIGKTLHDQPSIPAYGYMLAGDVLRAGQVVCIEAQLVEGSDMVVTSRDGWSVGTKDGGWSAMFEYMVVVGKEKPEVLTPTLDWEIVV